MSRSAGEMSTPLRLGLFGAGLVAVFGVAVAVGPIVVSPSAVSAWAEQSEQGDHEGGEHEMTGEKPTPAEVPGLSIEADGYRFADLTAPAGTDEPGELRFRILGTDGEPVTEFDVTHEKQLHLIAVRADGSSFRHVHPELDPDGTWSIPWTWSAAGAHRLFADFRPTGHDRTVTLTNTAQVNGHVHAGEVAASGDRVAEAGPFTVELAGDLDAGTETELVFTVRRDGEPVTDIQPYLGAAGHLVMLRAGDLGYLHVHPLDEAEKSGATDLGPDIRFGAAPPTAGGYFLYLDFQVDGQVYTASFAVDAATSSEPTSGSHSDTGAHGGEH
ncbi:heavy-metal-associated domain-containing protein [Agromyces sp. NPDC049794]|uniref:heavy-metal-associated domain-containing protein n=1 Tax=unclassified Agromyces TaxID=2639701 RepID=UPI0033E29FB9